MNPITPPPGFYFFLTIFWLVVACTILMVLVKVAAWWGERYSITSSDDDWETTPVRSPVRIPVLDTAPVASGIPDIDAETPSDRDIMGDDAWIDRMARARGKGKQYQFSANQIHAAIGGDRNTVHDKVRAIRDAVPPGEYFQPDGSRSPATHPVTGKRTAA